MGKRYSFLGVEVNLNIAGKASKIVHTKIQDNDLYTYYLGFDIDDEGIMNYRLKDFVKLIINIIPEFAFGYHQGKETPNDELLTKVYEAAKAIYKIKEFKEVGDMYLSDQFLEDDIEIDKKYLKRGEFGELILHFLLKNFHNTIPLISKVYFKDSYGHAVHGFDSVHINEDDRTLWLGESKLYTDGKKGLTALIQDINEHFNRDYLNDEFTIISNRIKDSKHLEEKANMWLDLLDSSNKLADQLKQIVVPLICTYSCTIFEEFSNEEDEEFIKRYDKEIQSMKRHFDDNFKHPLKDRLKIVVVLFPVQSKNQLIKNLHKKLILMQKLGE